jgi:hypothetical protein
LFFSNRRHENDCYRRKAFDTGFSRYEDVSHTIFSLAQAPGSCTREPFSLEPLYHTRGMADMVKVERDMAMAALLTGQDAFVTEKQACQLFLASAHVPFDFTNSRHAAAIAATWLAHAHAELLAITHTSYGHLPRVLCDLIMSY